MLSVFGTGALGKRRIGGFAGRDYSSAGWWFTASMMFLLVSASLTVAADTESRNQPHLASVHAKVVPLDAVRNGWSPMLRVATGLGQDGMGVALGGTGVAREGTGVVQDGAGVGAGAGFRANGESSLRDWSQRALVSKFADESAPIASVTKLMTALVVLESGASLSEWLVMPARLDEPPKNAWSRIRVDSRATREDLLRITLMASENYAAYALARHHPGGIDQFVADMNARAAELGMLNTRFHDPAGLWVENVSTATDLVQLLLAANEYREIREMSTTTWHRVHFRSPQYHLDFGNTNPLLQNDRWNISLSKTGYLEEAGRCLVMVAVLDGEPTAIVLLDSFGQRSPIGDAGRIRRWVESGAVGTVAGAAAEYERERAARFRSD
jgi:D-alanyl-D-alanine endopeptidase (penicillin-binding protein 7)